MKNNAGTVVPLNVSYTSDVKKFWKKNIVNSYMNEASASDIDQEADDVSISLFKI